MLPSRDDDSESPAEWVSGLIDRLSGFDRDMNDVVVEAGMLAGIPRGALSETGKTITLQVGNLVCKLCSLEVGVKAAVGMWTTDILGVAHSHPACA